MGVRMHEPRRRDFSGRIHFDVGLCPIEPADFHDALTAHADVALESRRTAAIDDARVPDQEIEMVFHCSHSFFKLKSAHSPRSTRRNTENISMNQRNPI